MSRLSDIKLQFLKGNYSRCLWYITKQNCNFRDLAMMARILEMWNDNPNESFQTFFDRTKIESPFNSYISNSPHRALKNCEFYGLMYPETSKSKVAYSSKNLTEVYREVKSHCNCEFEKTEKYQDIINRELEKMSIIVENKEINPVMFTLKVLITLGDATGNYKLLTNEFKLFVCTCNEWSQFFQAVESIMRFRSDDNYQKEVLVNYGIANDSRFNLVFDNLSYIEKDNKGFGIKNECIDEVRKKLAEYELGSAITSFGNSVTNIPTTFSELSNGILLPYLTAIRTKPFLLLAGISGTGKSRIVRELAFKSCPKYLQDKDGTTPGNYCMIEVKPNWHDSTELLGYYSNLSKSYQFKKFVKFLVKAKLNPDVPFFVCLDEMNLAPVEHYFAEILSIIETRKHPKKENSDEVDMNVIKTGSIVESQYFKEMAWKDNDGTLHQKTDMSDKDWYEYFFDVFIMSEDEKKQIEKYQYSRTLQEEGLTLPDNVIIIGTVNMDDTTHQFSRKVIDRAMTIEMNGGKLSEMYGGSKNLEYLSEKEQQKWQGAFRQRYVTADEVLEAHANEAKDIMEKVPARLEEINKALKGTPFEVSYRVLNELTIMIGVMLDDPEEGSDIDSIIDKAVDRILLMKILPRIEGDSDMFNLSQDFQRKQEVKYSNRLEWLKELAPAIVDENDEKYQQTARGKIQEMIDRLENQEFTRFWP